MTLTNTVTKVQDYARAGEQVPVQVVVENLSSQSHFVKPQIGWSVSPAYGLNIPHISEYGDWRELTPGARATFNFSFPMYDLEPTMHVHVAVNNWVWDFSAEKAFLDDMTIGRNVRALVPNPYYTVRIVNPPAGIFVWSFGYISGIYGSGPHIVNPDTVWRSPWAPLAGEVTYNIRVYDEYGGKPPDYALIHYNKGPITIIPGGEYVYDCATRTLSGGEVAGELLIPLVWWEGKEGWNQILETNDWPPNTAILTTWKVKNTGDESAVFKTRLLGVESAEAWLTPGATFTFEQPAIFLILGTHHFTLEILADDEVVDEFPFQVIASEEYKGTIITKELEYDETRGNIPVY